MRDLESKHYETLARLDLRGWVDLCLGVLIVLSALVVGQPVGAAEFRDAFADRQLSTADRESLSADNATASSEAGEPRHAGRRPHHSLWVSWIAPSDGIMTLDTRSSRIDTVTAVYVLEAGDKPPFERLKPIAASSDKQGTASELVQFGAQAGVRYEIAVDGFSSLATGEIRMNWEFTPVTSPPPVNLVVPADRALRVGDTLTLTIGFELGQDVSLQWEYNEDDSALPGQSSPTLVIPNFQANQVGQYRVRFTVDRVRFYSNPVEVQVNSEGLITTLARNRLEDAVGSPLGGALASPAGTRNRLRLMGAAPAGVVRGFNGTQIFHTIYAGRDPGEPVHCGVPGGASYWLAYVPPAAGTLTLDTEGSAYDTILAVYTYEPPLVGYESLISVACDNNSGAGGLASRLSFAAAAGRNYLVVVDGANGARGLAQLNYQLEANPPPATAPLILSSPASRSLLLGAPTTLSVTATGTEPLAFQWSKDGVALDGATAMTLEFPSVNVADAGVYTVTVTNDVGTATSTPAVLTVLVPPEITVEPTPRTLIEGASTTLSVTATGSAPLTYQWSKGGLVLAGATAATLEFASVSAADAGAYTATVSNEAGTATSAPAELTVLVPARIEAAPTSQTLLAGASATLSVTATGTAPLAFQWAKGGVALAGATLETLEFAVVSPADAGSYTVTVTNVAGTATSAPAVLTVLVPPQITTEPTEQALVLGASTTLSVTATGTAPLAFQWAKDGAPLTGATSATLDFVSVKVSDAGVYTVTVTNVAGTTTSAPTTLTVLVPPQITIAPVPQTLIAGASTTLGVTATGTAPLAYQWSKDGVALAGATAASLELESVSGLQAGSYTVTVTNLAGTTTSEPAAVSVLIPPEITAAPESQSVTAGDAVTLSVTATGTAPLAYQWAKEGLAIPGATGQAIYFAAVGMSDAGSYTVTVTNLAGTATSAAAVLAVSELVLPPRITSAPTGVVAELGAPVTLRVGAEGTPPLEIQWLKDGQIIPGANISELTLVTTEVFDAGTYTVRIVNERATVTSAPVSVQLWSPAQMQFDPDLGRFRVSFVAAGGLAYGVETSGEGGVTPSNWQAWTGPLAIRDGVVTLDAPTAPGRAFFVRVAIRAGVPGAAAKADAR